MNKNWIWNPKTKGSGIITCIPQKGRCPYNCKDCFFQGGRSYLEPLEKNLPHIPPIELTKGRIIRMNDGSDSNVERKLVEKTAQQFNDYFFNTSDPEGLSFYPGPVVFTVNPGGMTDRRYFRTINEGNLMFVRVRTNTWNINTVVRDAIDYYIEQDVPVVLTFMAYYTTPIPEKHKQFYEWTKRTLNNYWVIKPEKFNKIMSKYRRNPYYKSLVYSCGTAHKHECKYCGNCIREYCRCMEDLKKSRETIAIPEKKTGQEI